MKRIAALLTLLSLPLAAADAVRLVRGPWWWHGADGSPSLAVAVAGRPALPAVAEVDGRGVALASTAFPLSNDGDGADQVVAMRLSAGTTGTARVVLGGHPLTVRLRLPPPTDGPARIALAGGRAWPDRAGLETLGRHLGGEAQLVLALGPGVPARLGTGGWERDIPIAIAAPAHPAIAAATAEEDARWRRGLRVGILGLPASTDRSRADLAMAGDLSPWLVYLDIPAGWDPAIGQHARGDVRDLGVLLAACQRLKVPLALGAGAAGLVSEPLRMDPGGVVRTEADGVRYVLPVPADDDGLAGLGTMMAVPIEQPMLAGISADLGRLELVFARPSDPSAVRLAWTRGDAPANAATTHDCARLLTAAETLDTPAAREAMLRWSWLPRESLGDPAATPELIARLRDEGGAQGRLLARRLTVLAGDAPETRPIPGDPDPLAVRDLLLWRIATVRGSDATGWRNLAAASDDPLILRAILGDVARDPARELMPVLIERVKRQADGLMPIDPDPLDQHRLFAVVFDEVRLSPTLVRPWAVALRDKADPLARGPIDRFLARHGAVRPVE